MNDLIKKAKALAIKVHDGQVDKQGHEYILHPLAVAKKVKIYGPYYEAAGLLHDVIEDGGLSYDDLIELGFPVGVVDAVALLSRSEGETYKEFIEGILESKNPIALEVKLADLEHNTDPSRGGIPASLAVRYEKAISILSEVKS